MAPKAAPAKVKKEKKPKTEEDEKPKMNPPDRAAFDEKQKAVTDQIDELQKQLKALSGQIGERSSGKEEFFQKKNEIRARLDAVSEKIGNLKQRKDELHGHVRGKKEENMAMRQELNKLKKTIAFTSEEQIDERLREIEFSMISTSMTLKEEKKMIVEISELKKSRPKVSQYNQMEANVQNITPDLTIKEQLDDVNRQMSLQMEEKRAIQEEYKGLTDDRQSQMGGVQELFDSRDNLNKQIQEEIKKRNIIRDEFRQEEREYNAYLAEMRAARAEKSRGDRELRQKEYEMLRRQREADKLEEQPHVAEITLLEQTMAFCKTLQPKEKEAKTEKSLQVFENPDGHTILLPHHAREEEFYYAPTRGKAAKKQKAKDKSSSKAIKHNAETFRLFDQLKIDAPITTNDIPAVIEKLEEQMQEYQDKIAKWEVMRDEMRRKILEDGVLPELEAEATDVAPAGEDAQEAEAAAEE